MTTYLVPLTLIVEKHKIMEPTMKVSRTENFPFQTFSIDVKE
jgi:hypothetical protein